MARIPFRPYPFFLHVALLTMAVLTVGLVLKNQELEKRLAPPPLLAQGDTALPIAVRDLAGRSETFQFVDKSQETILMVFTTTCPACKANQAGWKSLYEELSSHYDVLAISLDDDITTSAYRDQYDLPFPVFVAAGPEDFIRDYAASGIPLTVHVDRQGEVQDAWLGVLSETALAEIQALKPDRMASTDLQPH